MPEVWDATTYRLRAAVWRKFAAERPEGDEQAAIWLAIARDYDRLADLIEQRRADTAG
jgi:hypothetical protein